MKISQVTSHRVYRVEVALFWSLSLKPLMLAAITI
jgi:hypothetical protein